MIDTQAVKFVNIAPPAAILDNASTTTNNDVDTKGWDYLTVLVSLGATDIAMAALKLQESNDDASADAYADITGATFASSLPSATDDNKLYAFFVNLQGRERYIRLVATAGDGTTGSYISAVGILSRGEEMPYDATTRGLGGQVIV